jgi:hypothetical protein
MFDTPNANVYRLIDRKAEQSSEEHYRVGCTTDGKTTLTMIGEDCVTMTLTMNKESCEQMIRMLRATYPATDVKEHNK